MRKLVKTAVISAFWAYLALSPALAQETALSKCEFLTANQNLYQKTVSLRVVNPNGEIVGARAVFEIPEGATPVNLGLYAAWDAAARRLSFDLGDFAGGEEKQFLVDFEGRPGACLIFGNLEGTWSPAPAAGPAEWREQINFSFTIVVSEPAASPVGDFLNNLRGNEFLQEAAPEAALTAGALGGVAAAGIPWWNLFQLLQLASLGALRKKPERPWGAVFDKMTRNPISGAAVKVYDAADGKLKDTALTDVEGRFGFLVAPGLYIVEVSKKSFENYKSDFVKVPERTEEALNLEIGLQPESPRFNVIQAIGNRLRTFFQAGNPWLLIFGTLISLVIAVLYPSPLHYIILAAYLVLDVIKMLIDSVTSRSIGKVVDKTTNQPIPLAVVRVYESRHNWLLFTHATNQRGHFKFLVTQGEYYITCSKQGYKPYTFSPLTIRKSDVIKVDIPLEPETAA